MAIDFSSLGTPTQSNNVQEVVSSSPGITLNLNKGEVLDLQKAAPSLENLDLGAGWDTAAFGEAFDLDITAFLLNANNKITGANDVIYFNNKVGQGIKLNGDNRTGEGDGDDEVISVQLSQISPSVQKIILSVVIFQAREKGQTFGQVNNSYIRLVNKNNGSEVAKFQLKNDFSTETAVIFGELVRNGNTWLFHAIGEGLDADLNQLAQRFQ